MSAVQSKAMLAQLSISQWTGRKADKKVTGEVEQTHGAHDAGKFIKVLVAKELLEPVNKIVSRARETHYDMTLAWSDAGPRLLPSALFMEYTTKFRGVKTDFDKAVTTLVSQYATEVQAARVRLGTMYEPGDYPDPSEIRSKFEIRTEFTPVPDGDDFRISVTEDAQDELRNSVRDMVQARQASAVKATYARIRDVVSKIEERLSDPKAIFKDTLITNAIDLTAVLDGLNITDDPVITDICVDMRKYLLMPPSALRSQPGLRAETGRRAGEILRSLPDHG